MSYQRPQHNVIVEALHLMDAELLNRAKCYFGGGTAIVLKNGEYRLSLDVDFLCADADGYRELRNAVYRPDGIRAIFGEGIETVRPIMADQYGIRAIVALHGQPIKFEIVREARITLDGGIDPELGVPLLSTTSQFAEKLLANADRGLDRAVAYRDAIDLGKLVTATGVIPQEAKLSAEKAYGGIITRSLQQVLERLANPAEAAKAAAVLQMETGDFNLAARALSEAAVASWPTVDFPELPPIGNTCSP
ncbi:nucleotidyl transferase AbiEii/AbiGii toxin family protein [Bosea sp. RAC05]|uniref:nucleotidyl transferase AbiEii/AbiGii toxin family protein n=1 Tax=Bosea sp. RAC05 TaxID=1842539 RepID=UPI00083E4C7D|nr:nucleotidyl transferase AbiEii/AbiGii toxin family protein [Bosea sp. RAC05]AOG03213.1 hypothetical protein BSY19_5260 [Bosea sp. RAC05]